MIGLLAAALPLAFYLGYPSTFWNFDGVACAAALELGNPVYFFHSQHLLYGFLGFLFWKPLFFLGLHKALPALQIFTSLLSAAALYLVWRLLAELSKDRWLAFFLTGATGFSAVYWTWSIEVQVYALGVLGLSGATYVLLTSEDPARMKNVGVWHGIAMLGHLVHGLWIIPALYWASKEKKAWQPYLAALTGTVFIAYTAVALFVLLPYHGQGPWLNHWLKGSLGLTPDRSIGWHGSGYNGALLWLKATPYVLWGNFSHGSSVLAGLSALLLLAAVVALLRSRTGNRIVRFSLIWLAVYAVFFSTWEPRTLCYRMSDLIPLALLLMVAAMTCAQRSLRLALAGLWMATLGMLNFFTIARPMHDSENNLLYWQTMALAKATPERSMYLTSGGTPWMYLLYFTGRSAWDVHTLSLNEFGKSWSALQPRPALYAASALLHDPDAGPWLTQHHLKLMPGLSWLEVS